MKIERILWRDSYGATSDWQSVADATETSPCMCVSIGVVILDAPHKVVIAPHIYRDYGSKEPTDVCGVMSIPTDAIVKRTELGDLD